MLPRSTTEDVANGSFGQPELLGDVFVDGSIRSENSDFPNQVLIQLGVTNIAPSQNRTIKNVDTVKYILGASYPFEIHKSVVASDSIQMIGVGLVWKDSSECLKHEPVNSNLEHNPVFAEADMNVALRLLLWFKDSIRVTSHATKIGHTIKSFITGDCFPNFGGGNFVRHISLSIQGWFRLGVRYGFNRSGAVFFLTQTS